MTTTDLTLRRLIVDRLDGFGDRPAIVAGGVSTTYRELAVLVNRLANALIDRGVQPGDPVAILLPNSLEYVVVDLAIIAIGAAKVPLNEMLSASDIDYCINDSGAVVAFVGPTLLPALVSADCPALREVVAVGVEHEMATPWAAFLQDSSAAPPPDRTQPDQLGLILYTGGTTGLPKGVMHTSGRLAINMVCHVVELGLGDDERMLLVSPLPHSAGFHLQAGLVKGAVGHLDDRFDPAQVLERIETDGITFTFMVPTMIYRLLDHVSTRERNLSSLRTVLYGAAPIAPDRLEQGLAVFGPVFTQLFGQSEAPNFITRLTKTDHLVTERTRHRLQSCGRPVPMAQVRIVDIERDDLVDVPLGEVGEIAARAPYLMAGYLGKDDVTAETLVDGWLRTGDVGLQDEDGYVYLRDRKKDMIISGGMNVYTTEVEGVVSAVPGVSSVAVVGQPHADWGEAVTACVVPEAAVDLAALREQIDHTCRAVLAKYKVPKQIVFLDALPLTSVGKIDKKGLQSTLVVDYPSG